MSSKWKIKTAEQREFKVSTVLITNFEYIQLISRVLIIFDFEHICKLKLDEM